MSRKVSVYLRVKCRSDSITPDNPIYNWGYSVKNVESYRKRQQQHFPVLCLKLCDNQRKSLGASRTPPPHPLRGQEGPPAKAGAPEESALTPLTSKSIHGHGARRGAPSLKTPGRAGMAGGGTPGGGAAPFKVSDGVHPPRTPPRGADRWDAKDRDGRRTPCPAGDVAHAGAVRPATHRGRDVSSGNSQMPFSKTDLLFNQHSSPSHVIEKILKLGY